MRGFMLGSVPAGAARIGEVPLKMLEDESEFLLSTSVEALTGTGRHAALEPGRLSSLAARARRFFVSNPEGPRILVGAIPYDTGAPDCLFQPAHARRGPPASAPVAEGAVLAGRCRLVQVPSVATYRRAVEIALGRLPAEAPAAGTHDGADGLRKVVLSRSLVLTSESDIDADALLARLRQDPTATVFSVPLPPRRAGVARRLVGATPELLLSRRGSAVLSHPLAGSARRSGDAALDRAIGAALVASSKDRHEHALVVEAVLDALAPFCTGLGMPQGTTLYATATMWHLGTRIEGVLRDPDTPAAALLTALHPTPAVCGLPPGPADAALRALEGYDRGFYAGAVGWLDAAGDGEWYVALRCAEVEGRQARLYAGAGIVPGSSPEKEAQETSAKFLAMLGALGIDETGALLREHVA